MDDNQVYTTAKSAEVKRKIKGFLKWLNSELENYGQKIETSKRKSSPRKNELKSAQVKERIQNIQIVSTGKEKSDGEILNNIKTKLPPEQIQVIVTATLFILILLIMAIGIYLPLTSK